MPYFEFKLEEFKFPKDLPGGNANFRFYVDLRFINDDNKCTTEQAVMPGPDTFWECDQDEKDERNYVRDDTDSKFDQNRLQEWDKLILLVKGQFFHSILFTVYDVDRKDVWDKVQNFGMKVLEAGIGKIKTAIPGNLPLSLPDSLGGAVDDLQSFMLKKIAGGDNILFRGSTGFRPDEKYPEKDPKFESLQNGHSESFPIKGHGKEGEYEITFSVTKIA